jgi:glycosyltransferase involved in cell wall biosynthesis
MFGSNLWGTLAGRLCRVGVVIAHEQTWSYEGNLVRRWLDGFVIGRLATRFVAVSSADAARMVSVEHVPEKNIVVIPNAYIPRPVGKPVDLRAELGLPASTPLIGVAAVLRQQKALHVLIEAFARVLETVPHAHLAIAGHGPCEAELRQRVAELGVGRSVHFLGRRTDVDAILRSVDVASMSSDFEGTPLFAMECLANRTPLVATRVGGLPDIIEDGRTGLLVPPRDPEAQATALCRLLLDPSLRAEIAEAGAARVQDFTIERITRRFTDLYEQLVAQSQARAAGS